MTHLKRGRGLLCAGSDMTVAVVAKDRHIRPMSRMRDGPGVSRSGFDTRLGRLICARARDDAKRVVESDKRFKASGRTCGARRALRDGPEAGLACGLRPRATG